MKKHWTIIIIFCLLVIQPSIHAMKGDKREEPIIVYHLTFCQIDSDLVEHFESELTVTDDENQEKWQFSRAGDLLKYIHDNKYYLTSHLSNEESRISSEYISWLATIGKNEIVVKIVEEEINVEDGERRSSYFQIQLQPNSIDYIDKRIFTSVQIGYKASNNPVGDIVTTSWVSETTKQPLMVVSRNKESSSNIKKEYLALYMTAEIISFKEYIRRYNCLTAGDIGALNKVFKSSKPNKVKKLDYFFDLSLAGSQILYEGGLNYPLSYDGLALTSYLTNDQQTNSPIIRFGIKDQVSWWNNFDVGISYLPISYKLGGMNSMGPLTSLKLGYRYRDYRVWYQRIIREDRATDELGLGYQLKPYLDLEALLHQTGDDPIDFIFGLKIHK